LRTAILELEELTFWLSEREKMTFNLFHGNPEMTLYEANIAIPKHASKPANKGWFGGTKQSWEDEILVLQDSSKNILVHQSIILISPSKQTTD
jgi:hypothetical protein